MHKTEAICLIRFLDLETVGPDLFRIGGDPGALPLNLVRVRPPVGSRKTLRCYVLEAAATLCWLLGPGRLPQGAREPPRDDLKNRKWASHLGGMLTLLKRPGMMKTLLF